MKNSMLFLVSLCLLAAISCNKTDDRSNCIEQYVEDNNLEPYYGQDIGCLGHYVHLRYEGDDYLMYNNHCADIIPSPFLCGGDYLEESKLNDFLRKAEWKEIIGVVE